jgi:hypothetical protein
MEPVNFANLLWFKSQEVREKEINDYIQPRTVSIKELLENDLKIYEM